MPEFTSATSGSCYKFAPITENQVFQEIKLLGERSNLDILNIDSKLIFLSAHIIAPTLTKLFNLSLTSGVDQKGNCKKKLSMVQ